MAQEVCSGAIWTDAHGVAAVTLPAHAEGDLVVEVHALADGVTAEVAAELKRRRFTVATSEPYVKVAWRVTLRGPLAEARPREET
jgi:hypothetical protein